MFCSADKKYLSLLDTRGVFDNTTKSALAQTEVAKIVRRHFSSGGEKTKKALLIGFDGARADTMQLLCESESEPVSGALFTSGYSAVNALKAEGGLYLSYAGGEKDDPQETSTAQGWAAILTGVWGGVNGVKKHVPLKNETPTVLRELAEQGKTAAFLAEWNDHFTITYKNEIELVKHEKTPLRFIQFETDKALQQAFLQEIQNGTDCIFGIFEGPDYNGHSTQFGMQNYRYVMSVLHLDNIAYSLLEAVKARPTYAEEDWLILITSDHGGHKHGHGTQQAYDRMTFIACNQKLSV